jgi:hypothetical protein
MTIYSKEMKTTRRRVEDAMKENREECMLMGGDFNGRIGERGVRNWEEEREDGKRKSKDNREETVIDYGIVNEEAWEGVEEVRIGERAEADHVEIALRKRRGGKEQRKKGVGERNKTVYLIFFLNCCFMCKVNVIRNRKARFKGKIKHSTCRYV